MEADDVKTRAADHAAESIAASERRIADRLDALEAERVIHRALELEAQTVDEPHTITTEQLEKIAAEIGVDASFVHQALGEVRLEGPDRSWFDRLVLPEDLVETRTISGLTRDDLDAAIKKWMTQNEGLIASGQLRDGIEWDLDRRWRTRALSRSLSGNNRISRVASGDVTHRVHTLTETEHVVAFGSEGRLPLGLAKLVMALGVIPGVFLLLSAATSGEFFAGLGLFAALTAVGIGGAIVGARWWARGIRGALRRSLTGLSAAAKPKRRWFSRRKKDRPAN